MFRSFPIVDRFFQFFSLPDCYLKAIKFEECKKSRVSIALDMLDLFFSYKTYPDNYLSCRLWEVEKTKWKFYYGSNYHPYQRAKLQRSVQPLAYRILFNDKALCQKLCIETGVRQPHTFGTINPDQNYKEKITKWLHDSGTELLFIKPRFGRAGIGIVLARKTTGGIVILTKNDITPLNDYVLKEKAIVQEVVVQDRRMAVFSKSSLNTIRIVTMYTKKESVIVLNAMMRSGIGASYVDNFSAGGVAVGVDCKTGKLKKYAYDKKGRRYIEHPTSKVVFENFMIPEWRHILDTAEKIQKTFPCYRLLGLDIGLHETGEPILIELNAAADLAGLEQKAGPMLQNVEVLRAFGEEDLLVNKHQRNLHDNLLIKK